MKVAPVLLVVIEVIEEEKIEVLKPFREVVDDITQKIEIREADDRDLH